MTHGRDSSRGHGRGIGPACEWSRGVRWPGAIDGGRGSLAREACSSLPDHAKAAEVVADVVRSFFPICEEGGVESRSP
jgi:hypothetical protein